MADQTIGSVSRGVQPSHSEESDPRVVRNHPTPAWTGLSVKYGKSKNAKTWPGSAPAALTVPLNRYNCGMTVGNGWYHRLSHVDPAGSACAVFGWFSDGRVQVALPHGGCGIVGRADVEVREWPSFVTDDQRAAWAALPMVSRVVDGEMLAEAV
jgi:hypothetical protein